VYECCTVDVGGSCDIHNARVVTARKEYKCGECGAPILPGQRYEYVTMLYEGLWNKHRTCLLCMTIRDDLCQNWYYGMVDDQIQECYGVSLRDNWWGWDDEEEE
jgi:hypothetical protein